MNTDVEYNAAVIDYETLDITPWSCVVLDVGVVLFNTKHIHSFQELVDNGFHMKFAVEHQVSTLKRVISPDTLEWWNKQGASAKEILIPSSSDRNLLDFAESFESYLKRNQVNQFKMKLYARGSSFDITILRSIYQAIYGITYDNALPFRYWNERDVRTRIETFVDEDLKKIPVDKNLLKGFVKHNSIHDCAKDVIAMQVARQISFHGIPANLNIDDCELV